MKKILIIVLVLVILILGYFSYNKFLKKENIKPVENNIKIVRQNDPPFMLNFPAGLIQTEGIVNVIDSFRVEKMDSVKQQFTYKYVTTLPKDEVYYRFNTYFVKNGFKQGFLSSDKDYFSLNATKENMSVSVFIEKMKEGSGTSVDVSVIK